MLDTSITWIYNMIENDIILLNSIISKNYQLRIWFEEMETNMDSEKVDSLIECLNGEATILGYLD